MFTQSNVLKYISHAYSFPVFKPCTFLLKC